MNLDFIPTFVKNVLTSFTENENVIFVWDKVNNKYVGIIVGIGGFLTLRKVFDLVYRKWYQLPPGPIGMPLLGVLAAPKRSKAIYAANYYGPIYMAQIGFQSIVTINDYNLLTKYFSNKDFLDRSIVNAGFDNGLKYQH